MEPQDCIAYFINVRHSDYQVYIPQFELSDKYGSGMAKDFGL